MCFSKLRSLSVIWIAAVALAVSVAHATEPKLESWIAGPVASPGGFRTLRCDVMNGSTEKAVIEVVAAAEVGSRGQPCTLYPIGHLDASPLIQLPDDVLCRSEVIASVKTTYYCHFRAPLGLPILGTLTLFDEQDDVVVTLPAVRLAGSSSRR